MIAQKDKKVLLSNFLSLASLQGVNYILPLLTFPYLVRVLGVENFGLLAFATAVISYFNIFTDYGFNLTATREISIYRDNREKVTEIFSAVMSIKIVLMLISFIFLTILVFSFEKFSKDWEVYFFTFGMVIGQVLFPVWFFQGMEKMKYITYLNIVAKTFFTVLIFLFVKEQSDFYLVPLFTSLGFILVGVWSLWIVRYHFAIRFKYQPKENLVFYLKDGWYLFQAQMYVNLYNASTVSILGVLTNNIVVGYYTIAERIVKSVGGLFIPANQAIYPFIAKLCTESKNKMMHFIRRISMIYLMVSILIFSGLYIYKDMIIIFVHGSLSKEISEVYTILLFMLFTLPFTTLYGQMMVIFHQSKKISQITRDIFFLYLLTAPLFVLWDGAVGLSIVVVTLQYLVVFRYIIEIFYRQKSLA